LCQCLNRAIQFVLRAAKLGLRGPRSPLGFLPLTRKTCNFPLACIELLVQPCRHPPLARQEGPEQKARRDERKAQSLFRH
jgi:hypothetical protein